MSDGGGRKIALAAVAGAHGVKGELRLKLFSDSIESLSRHDSLYVGGVERRLLSIRDAGKNAVARFDGISDRLAAEGLRGSFVDANASDVGDGIERTGLEDADDDPRLPHAGPRRRGVSSRSHESDGHAHGQRA